MPELQIIISAVDQTGRAFKKIKVSLDELERTSRKSTDRASKAFKGLGGAIRSASGGITGAISGVEGALSDLGPAGIAAGAAVGAVSLALIDAINVTQQFEQAITNAATVTGKTGKELEKAKENIKDVAEELGKTTVFSAREAANALYIVASAGQDVSKITADELVPALNLAAGMGTDLTMTMETLISTANMYGMEFKDIAKISDVITAAWGNSQASLEKFRYSMKYVGPVAHALNYSLEETTALLMGLYNAGKTGEEAGTTLRGAFSRLLNPTKRTTETLDELGVSIYDASGQMRPFIDILDDLKKANITTAQAAQIFGDVAGPGIMALMSQGADSIRKFQKELENAGGTAERVAKEQLNTFQGQMKLFQSALESAKIEVGEALLPALTELLKIITKIIPPLIEIGGVVYDALKDAFEPLGDILRDIAEIFDEVNNEGEGLKTTLDLLSWTLKRLLLGIKITLTILRELIRILKPILIPAFKTLGSIIKTLNDIFGKSNKEISTNTKEVEKNASSLQLLSTTVNKTGKQVSVLMTLSKGFAIELQILKDIFNSLKEAFIDGINLIVNAFTKLKDIAVSGINIIIGSIQSLTDLLSSDPSAAINIVINSFNFLKDTTLSIITEIKNIFQSLIDLILVIPQKIGEVISSFNSLKSSAEKAFEAAQKAVEVVAAPVHKVVGGITKVVMPAKTKPMPPTKKLTTPATTITGTVSKAVDTISGAATGIVKTVGNVVSKAVNTISGVIGGIGKVLGFQQGGTVPATGIYYLHKGERVLNPRETKEYDKGKAIPQVSKTINFNFDKIYLSEKYSLTDLEKDLTRDYARGV